MAKLLVYAVYDSKIQTFAQPFQMRTKGEAIRGWIEVVNDPKTTVCKYPEDFSLMELGSYDESTGRFENLTAPINMGLASSFKHVPQEQAPLDFNRLSHTDKKREALASLGITEGQPN